MQFSSKQLKAEAFALSLGYCMNHSSLPIHMHRSFLGDRMTAAPLVAAGPGVSHHVAVVISGKVAGGAGVADAADITCTGAAANTNALAWEEVGCHVPARRRKGQEVTLMQGVCGVARSGDLVAIIGKQHENKMLRHG